MTKQPEAQYWRPIAESMDVEDRKLRLYVRHRHSLGVGRESILRSVLIAQTPEPYRVKTGFVAHISDRLVTSDQCDILVYDPTTSQPLYRIDEFVVVPHHAARIGIEVRSNLSITDSKRKVSSSGLDQMFKVCKSMRKFPTQVFGFAYKGVKFDDFVMAVAKRVEGDILNVPECIAVHRQNYFSVRITDSVLKMPPIPRLCIAIDCSQIDVDGPGLATAHFLGLYNYRVREAPALDIVQFAFWARERRIPDSAIRMIHENGQITQGPIPSQSDPL